MYNELNEVKKVEAENDIPLATSSPMLVAEQKTKMLGWPSTGLVHMYVWDWKQFIKNLFSFSALVKTGMNIISTCTNHDMDLFLLYLVREWFKFYLIQQAKPWENIFIIKFIYIQ